MVKGLSVCFRRTPQVAGVTVMRRGRVRRAKLYYLRGRTGKAARIAEKTNYREELHLLKLPDRPWRRTPRRQQ